MGHYREKRWALVASMLFIDGCGGESARSESTGGTTTSNGVVDAISGAATTSGAATGTTTGDAATGTTTGDAATGGAATGSTATGSTATDGTATDGTAAGGGSGSGAGGGSGGGTAEEWSPTWTAQRFHYGSLIEGISFLEDGAVEVRAWGAFPSEYMSHSFEKDGEARSLDMVGVANAFAADPNGRFYAISSEGGCYLLADGTPGASLGVSCNGGYGFAPDASFVSQVACFYDSVVHYVGVFDAEQDRLEADIETEVPCTDSSTQPLVLTDSVNRRTLFATPENPEVFVFDWAQGTVRALPVHDSSEPSKGTHLGTFLGMSLSHDGTRLLTVGVNDGVAVLDASSYEVLSRLPNVPYFNMYEDCACPARSLSALAWSPDDAFYVTTNTARGLDLRKANGHSLVAHLTAPVPAEGHSIWLPEYGPIVVGFSADGQRLAALYPDAVVVYDLELP